MTIGKSPKKATPTGSPTKGAGPQNIGQNLAAVRDNQAKANAGVIQVLNETHFKEQLVKELKIDEFKIASLDLKNIPELKGVSGEALRSQVQIVEQIHTLWRTRLTQEAKGSESENGSKSDQLSASRDATDAAVSATLYLERADVLRRPAIWELISHQLQERFVADAKQAFEAAQTKLLATKSAEALENARLECVRLGKIYIYRLKQQILWDSTKTQTNNIEIKRVSGLCSNTYELVDTAIISKELFVGVGKKKVKFNPELDATERERQGVYILAINNAKMDIESLRAGYERFKEYAHLRPAVLDKATQVFQNLYSELKKALEGSDEKDKISKLLAAITGELKKIAIVGRWREGRPERDPIFYVSQFTAQQIYVDNSLGNEKGIPRCVYEWTKHVWQSPVSTSLKGEFALNFASIFDYDSRHDFLAAMVTKGFQSPPVYDAAKLTSAKSKGDAEDGFFAREKISFDIAEAQAQIDAMPKLHLSVVSTTAPVVATPSVSTSDVKTPSPTTPKKEAGLSVSAPATPTTPRAASATPPSTPPRTPSPASTVTSSSSVASSAASSTPPASPSATVVSEENKDEGITTTRMGTLAITENDHFSARSPAISSTAKPKSQPPSPARGAMGGGAGLYGVKIAVRPVTSMSALPTMSQKLEKIDMAEAEAEIKKAAAVAASEAPKQPEQPKAPDAISLKLFEYRHPHVFTVRDNVEVEKGRKVTAVLVRDDIKAKNQKYQWNTIATNSFDTPAKRVHINAYRDLIDSKDHGLIQFVYSEKAGGPQTLVVRQDLNADGIQAKFLNILAAGEKLTRVLHEEGEAFFAWPSTETACRQLRLEIFREWAALYKQIEPHLGKHRAEVLKDLINKLNAAKIKHWWYGAEAENPFNSSVDEIIADLRNRPNRKNEPVAQVFLAARVISDDVKQTSVTSGVSKTLKPSSQQTETEEVNKKKAEIGRHLLVDPLRLPKGKEVKGFGATLVDNFTEAAGNKRCYDAVAASEFKVVPKMFRKTESGSLASAIYSNDTDSELSDDVRQIAAAQALVLKVLAHIINTSASAEAPVRLRSWAQWALNLLNNTEVCQILFEAGKPDLGSVYYRNVVWYIQTIANALKDQKLIAQVSALPVPVTRSAPSSSSSSLSSSVDSKFGGVSASPGRASPQHTSLSSTPKVVDWRVNETVLRAVIKEDFNGFDLKGDGAGNDEGCAVYISNVADNLFVDTNPAFAAVYQYVKSLPNSGSDEARIKSNAARVFVARALHFVLRTYNVEERVDAFNNWHEWATNLLGENATASILRGAKGTSSSFDTFVSKARRRFDELARQVVSAPSSITASPAATVVKTPASPAKTRDIVSLIDKKLIGKELVISLGVISRCKTELGRYITDEKGLNVEFSEKNPAAVVYRECFEAITTKTPSTIFGDLKSTDHVENGTEARLRVLGSLVHVLTLDEPQRAQSLAKWAQAVKAILQDQNCVDILEYRSAGSTFFAKTFYPLLREIVGSPQITAEFKLPATASPATSRPASPANSPTKAVAETVAPSLVAPPTAAVPANVKTDDKASAFGSPLNSVTATASTETAAANSNAAARLAAAPVTVIAPPPPSIAISVASVASVPPPKAPTAKAIAMSIPFISTLTDVKSLTMSEIRVRVREACVTGLNSLLNDELEARVKSLRESRGELKVEDFSAAELALVSSKLLGEAKAGNTEENQQVNRELIKLRIAAAARLVDEKIDKGLDATKEMVYLAAVCADASAKITANKEGFVPNATSEKDDSEAGKFMQFVTAVAANTGRMKEAYSATYQAFAKQILGNVDVVVKAVLSYLQNEGPKLGEQVREDKQPNSEFNQMLKTGQLDEKLVKEKIKYTGMWGSMSEKDVKKVTVLMKLLVSLKKVSADNPEGLLGAYRASKAELDGIQSRASGKDSEFGTGSQALLARLKMIDSIPFQKPPLPQVMAAQPMARPAKA